eukprot:CAMPEP_0172368930 /NCGR_PEP_ID=MMETSP1060-20121228/29647_1 /TAXON_ID=37318 /ORGANISM="Pseudo-nitzschia pungens, Strain cf. cingulata" /LENGTH=221 /DNA_ID=CAMNT_0013093673 /DNA_START=62 /DNA_END=728 /DNA_ORIENTATION=-
MFSVSENDVVVMFLAGGTVQLFSLSAAMWIVIITLQWKKKNTNENSLHDQTACCCCCYDGGDATGGIMKKQRRGIEPNKLLITSSTGGGGDCCSSGCCDDDDDDDDRTIETCDSMDSEDSSQTEDEIIHGIDIVNNGLTRSTATTEHKNPSASSYYLLPTDGHPTHDCRHLDTPTRATSQENNVMQQMMMMNESIHSPITSTAEQKDASSFPGSARPYYYW